MTNGLLLILLSLCGSGRGLPQAPEHVDRVEINTVTHDSQGDEYKIPMRQVILWHYHPEFGEYHVAEWFIISGDDHYYSEPLRTPAGWRWRYRGSWDGKQHYVVADECFTSKMTYDPEVADRHQLPVSMRRRLAGMVSTKRDDPPVIAVPEGGVG